MLALALALIATPAGGNISQRLASPPAFTLETPRPIADLELCVADALSLMAPPAVFRDGVDRSVLVADDRGSMVAAMDLRRANGRTQVVGHIRGKGWDDRIRERVGRCL